MSLRSKINKILRVIKQRNLYGNFFHNVSQMKNFTNDPIILCGCPRSGTTLLMSMLDSHPEIHVIPFETAVLQHRRLDKRIFKNRKLYYLFCRTQILFYLLSLRIKSSAMCWCEKTPLNILNIDEIQEIYKRKVRFINIIRDGRSVVSSRHSRFGYMVNPELWMKCINAGLSHESLPNFISIRYEDLIKRPEIVLAKLKIFLDLRKDFDAKEWIKKTNIKGNVFSLVNGLPEGSQVVGDVNTSRANAWEQSQSPQLRTFLNDDRALELNKRLGYV
jgi:hypothetical protein